MLAREQRDDQISKVKEAGVEYISLSAADKTQLITEAKSVYDNWGEKIGVDYLKISKLRSVIDS